MFKKISLVALMSAILIGTVGCSSNQDNAKESAKSEQSVKSIKFKKKTKEERIYVPEEFNQLLDKTMKSIKLKGTHDYEMRHINKIDNIDERVKFTLVDGKITKLKETKNFDERRESDLRKQAVLTDLQNMVEDYKGLDQFLVEVVETGEDQYQRNFTYNVENYTLEELLSDKMLLNGKFDLRHMVSVFLSEGYKLK